MRFKKTNQRLRLTVFLFGLSAGLTPAMMFSQTTPVFSQAYVWQNVKVVAGGFVPGIIFNLKQPGLAYCRTDIGSSYKWDNAARRWIPLTDWSPDSNLQGTESLATDPVDPNRLYLAQGMYARDPAAIFRSVDQGKTFQVINVPFRMGGTKTAAAWASAWPLTPMTTIFFTSARAMTGCGSARTPR